ncbi:hypothetical protein AAGG74_17640 [Bacillus mexicanus]|uniref:hypothetical protein n=1 Tax=Bacillus mexicanus TaxID=2834415 RepID=UPI003D1FEB12
MFIKNEVRLFFLSIVHIYIYAGLLLVFTKGSLPLILATLRELLFLSVWFPPVIIVICILLPFFLLMYVLKKKKQYSLKRNILYIICSWLFFGVIYNAILIGYKTIEQNTVFNSESISIAKKYIPMDSCIYKIDKKSALDNDWNEGSGITQSYPILFIQYSDKVNGHCVEKPQRLKRFELQNMNGKWLSTIMAYQNE